MSTNIRIEAHRIIQVVKTGAIDTQSTEFDTWQTPTRATWDIMNPKSLDLKLQAYREWVISACKDEIENVYAEDDLLQEDNPVGTVVINFGRDHISKLDEWLQLVERDGWEVNVVAW